MRKKKKLNLDENLEEGLPSFIKRKENSLLIFDTFTENLI